MKIKTLSFTMGLFLLLGIYFPSVLPAVPYNYAQENIFPGLLSVWDAKYDGSTAQVTGSNSNGSFNAYSSLNTGLDIGLLLDSNFWGEPVTYNEACYWIEAYGSDIFSIDGPATTLNAILNLNLNGSINIPTTIPSPLPSGSILQYSQNKSSLVLSASVINNSTSQVYGESTEFFSARYSIYSPLDMGERTSGWYVDYNDFGATYVTNSDGSRTYNFNNIIIPIYTNSLPTGTDLVYRIKLETQIFGYGTSIFTGSLNFNPENPIELLGDTGVYTLTSTTGSFGLDENSSEGFQIVLGDGIEPEPVPEPSTMFLLGSGLLGLWGLRKKFRK